MSRVASGLLVLLVALAAVGCGSGSGAATPALSSRLERVDAAAVADDPEALASAVAGLLRAVQAAETAGDLSAADADEIRTAADALLDAAEPDSPDSSVSPSTPEESTTTSAPPTDEDDDDEADQGDKKDDEKQAHGPRQGGGQGARQGRLTPSRPTWRARARRSCRSSG